MSSLKAGLETRDLRFKAATILIGVPLLALTYSAYEIWTFAGTQTLDGQSRIQDSFARETVFARLALGTLGLVVLLFPFRGGQRWGWVALTLLLFLYIAPVFAIPVVGPFLGLQAITEAIREPGLGRLVVISMVLTVSMALGLVISVKRFVD